MFSPIAKTSYLEVTIVNINLETANRFRYYNQSIVLRIRDDTAAKIM